MNILLTGGAGYIGTHTIIELINSGHSVVIIDNLINSSAESLKRVERIVNTSIPFYESDLRDESALDRIFKEHSIDAVIHFAGLKSVGESVADPIKYYENNLDSTLILIKKMREHGINRLVFSSSATVYGTPEELPLKESSRVGMGITNPYGQTKFMIEQILKDVAVANPAFEVTILRYFNPVGAHESGLIGEDPTGTPNNLLPYISQVAVGKLKTLKIFGDDYDTPDGTGVRDYIHVVDLAQGHVAAITKTQPGISVFNLGTGKGTSVFELIHAFERASETTVAYEVVERRPGDIASCYADPSKANSELGWQAKKDIDQACKDSWKWQSNNPNGYKL